MHFLSTDFLFFFENFSFFFRFFYFLFSAVRIEVLRAHAHARADATELRIVPYGGVRKSRAGIGAPPDRAFRSGRRPRRNGAYSGRAQSPLSVDCALLIMKAYLNKEIQINF
jgi:hypothetical protein